MPELGSIHPKLPTTPGSTEVKLNLANLWAVKAAATGKDEFRITSATATIQVVNRRENDGDIVAVLQPKQWSSPTADQLRIKAGFEKHISAQPWSVQLSSAGEWTNVANSGASLWIAGIGLEKETNLHIVIRGHVQYR